MRQVNSKDVLKWKTNFISMFFEIFSSYEHVLATLLEKWKINFSQVCSRICLYYSFTESQKLSTQSPWNFLVMVFTSIYINPLSANPTKWSNILQQFVSFCRRIVWVYLAILLSWHFFSFSWSLTICFIVASYSCMCSCPKNTTKCLL